MDKKPQSTSAFRKVLQALQGFSDGPQSFTRLEKAPVSTAHYLVRSVEEGQWKTSIDTMDPGSRQIAVEEGRHGLAGLRDGLAGLGDLVVVVAELY